MNSKTQKNLDLIKNSPKGPKHGTSNIQSDIHFQNAAIGSIKSSIAPSSIMGNRFFQPFSNPKFGEITQLTIKNLDNQQQFKLLSSINKPLHSDIHQEQNYFQNGLDFENLSIYSQNSKLDNNKLVNQDLLLNNNPKELLKCIEMFKEKKDNELSKLLNELKTLKLIVDELRAENDKLKMENIELFNENSKFKLSNTDKLNEVQNLQERCQLLKEKFESLVETVDSLGGDLDDYRQINESLSDEKCNLEEQLNYYKSALNEMEIKVQHLQTKLEQKEQTLAGMQENYLKQLNEEKEQSLKRIEQTQNEYQEKIQKLSETLDTEKRAHIYQENELNKLQKESDELKNQLAKIEILNDKLKLQLCKIDELREQNQEFQSRLYQNEQNIDAKNTEIENWKQQFKAQQKINQTLLDEYSKMESESFNLCEDVRKLYFYMKQVKSTISQMKKENSSLISIIGEQQKQSEQLEADLKQTQTEKEQLFAKFKIFEESQVLFKNMTDKLQSLIDSKELEYGNIIREKEKLIEELKQKNQEYIEKIRLIQLEKDKLFRWFHESMMNSFKQSPMSISSVAPIIKTNISNTDTTAFDITNQEISATPIDAVITDQKIEIGNTSSIKIPPSLNPNSDGFVNDDAVTEKQQSLSISTTNPTLIVPILKNNTNSNNNSDTPKTTTAVTINSSNKLGCKSPIIKDNGDNKKSESSVTGIIKHYTRRTICFDQSSKDQVDVVASSSRKTVRFSDNVIDNEKSDNQPIMPNNNQTSTNNNLPRYTRTNKSAREKLSSGIDMSFVKRKLDDERSQQQSAVNNINNKKQKSIDKHSEISWIDGGIYV